MMVARPAQWLRGCQPTAQALRDRRPARGSVDTIRIGLVERRPGRSIFPFLARRRFFVVIALGCGSPRRDAASKSASRRRSR
jgi:hypothetical protein